MRKDDRIVIIGGSLVGPSIAHVLRRAGLTNVVVYEKQSKSREQAGGEIGLAPDMLKLLAATVGVPPDQLAPLWNVQGTKFARTIEGRAVVRNESQTYVPTVSYPRAQPVLTSELGTEVWKPGHEFIGIHESMKDGRQGVEIEGPDGTIIEYPAVVIGADGRRSAVRDALERRPALFDGTVAYRTHIGVPREQLFDHCGDYHQPGFILDVLPTLQGDAAIADCTIHLPTTRYEAGRLLGRDPTTSIVFGLPETTIDYVKQEAMGVLPESAAAVIDSAETFWAVPNLTTAQPTRAHWRRGETDFILVGDAIMPKAPQLGAGLTSGIMAAFMMPQMLAAEDKADFSDQLAGEAAYAARFGRQLAEKAGVRNQDFVAML